MSDHPIEDDAPKPQARAPEMTRERARSERRDLDKERGEPVSGSRGGRRALRRVGRPLGDWTTRPRILVTNDDGIETRGILALKQALDPIGEVIVVAPDTNQSAVGHGKTLMRPLRVRERTLADGSTGYSIDGSPTDCVSLGLLGFFDEPFDLVASGINYGANLGDDITYSGTVSAAMEAVINGGPGLRDLAGVPTTRWTSSWLPWRPRWSRGTSWSTACSAASCSASTSRQRRIAECEGFEVTRVGRRVYQDELVQRLDPRGLPYYWIGGPPPSGISVPGTDFNAVVNRRISVTPIHLDLTGRRLLRQLHTWDWTLGGTPGAAGPGTDEEPAEHR